MGKRLSPIPIGRPVKKTRKLIHVTRYVDDSSARGTGQVPCLTFDFTINEIGYQLDIYLDGQLTEINCRDFGGAPGPRKAIERLLQEIEKAVDRWRNSL